MVVGRTSESELGRTPSPADVLARAGISALLLTQERDLDAVSPERPPELIVLDPEAAFASEIGDILTRCRSMKLPVLALVPEDRIADFNVGIDVDDLVLVPAGPVELVARARRVLARWAGSSDDLIRAGDLVIDPGSYQVSFRGGHVQLRFKEYELLVLMASNPGRAFTRETLLNRVWGYDYYGGIRTVDVHVRRLRSKLQDADNPLIETVWNVGYRFKDQGPT